MALNQVTIKEIAQLAGVSCSTVSRALNGSSSISEKTRSRILHICDTTGYRANAMARSLIRGKTNVIGLIVPEIKNPYYSEIAFNVEIHANKLGYNLIVCNGMNNDKRIKEIFSFLLGHQVDGIILASSHPEVPSWIEHSASTPLVLLGSVDVKYAKGINSVSVDNRVGGRIAAEHLLSLGHRDIVCLGYRPESITHHLRLNGFEDAVKAAGARLTVVENMDNSSSVTHGYELSRKFFSSNQKCSAIFAISDLMALGVMQYTDEYGIAVPDDISLIGFDNIMYSALPRIGLSTIDQRKEFLAQTAVDRLVNIIDSEHKEDPSQQLIRPVLVARNTCIQV